jgi:hypothetical protein
VRFGLEVQFCFPQTLRRFDAMKTHHPASWCGARCTRWIVCAVSLSAALLTLSVDANAETTDYATINAERARVRKLGNIVGLSLMGGLLMVPVVIVLRHGKKKRDGWEPEADAE